MKYADGRYITKAILNDKQRGIFISKGLVKLEKGSGHEFNQNSFFKANYMVRKVEEFKETEATTLTDKLTQATEAIFLTYHAKNSELSLDDCTIILLSKRPYEFGGSLLGYFTAKGWELEDNQEFDDFLDKLITKYI